MRKLKLKSKLIAGSLIMVLFVMIASTIVVSIIVRQQSEGMSNDQVRKAVNIVQNDLLEKKQKILTDARQMATTGDLGSSIKFLRDYKSKDSATITRVTYIQPVAQSHPLERGSVNTMSSPLKSTGLFREKGTVKYLINHIRNDFMKKPSHVAP